MPKTVEEVLAQNGITMDTTLSHVGVKGMRWGKRKKRAAEAAVAEKKKTLTDMSDEELRSKINRIKMEQEYSRLTAPQVSTGRKAVTSLLADVGKTQAKNYLNKEITKVIQQLGEAPKGGKLPNPNQLAIGR